MEKAEAQKIGFEIVAYAGEARSQLLEALEAGKAGDFDQADELITEAKQTLVDAHNAQTQMLAREAKGEDIEIGLILIHGQDHLMTCELLKDLIEYLLDIYRTDRIDA